MATVEEIKQQLERANKEYDEVKEKLERFEEGEKARRLDALRRGRAQEEFGGEKAELEGERKKLEKEKDEWKEEVRKWGETLREASTRAASPTWLPTLKDLLPRKRTSSPEVSIDIVKREKLEADYGETVQAGLDASGPSVAAKPAAFSSEQKKKPTILNGRPFEQTGPPVVLFHPVFGEFLQDMDDQNLSVPDRTYRLTEDLLWASAEFYTNEDARKNAITELLEKIWGHINSTNFGKHDCSSDGVLSTDINESVAYRMILEFKNEIGTSATDPTLQTTLYYRGYWSQANAKRVRDLCCCPTFGIAIAGPWMCILGAVFLNKAVTSFLPLLATPPDDKPVKRIARILVALDRAFKKLQTFYTGLTGSSVDEQRYFPHFRKFLDSADTPVSFTYLYQLTEERTRLVWKAKTKDGRPIVVKFAQRYNKDAHELCAADHVAPTVLYFGNGAELGEFHVLVMPYVDHQPLQPDEITHVPTRKTIYNDVKKAIDLLHAKHYVFADLRNPNILVVTRSGAQHAILIDFDWCGTEGKDTYPVSMSRKICWPDGVQPGGPLRRIHDLIWLGRLRKTLKLEQYCPDPTAIPE